MAKFKTFDFRTEAEKEKEKQELMKLGKEKWEISRQRALKSLNEKLALANEQLNTVTDSKTRKKIEDEIRRINYKIHEAKIMEFETYGSSGQYWFNQIGFDAKQSQESFDKFFNEKLSLSGSSEDMTGRVMGNPEIIPAKDFVRTSEPVQEPTPSAPEPTPEPAAAKPAATAGGGQTGRVTAAMKPAEFKPKYLEEIEPKSEEEYLGKDPNNWKTMSKAEKAAKAIGFIGDIGGDVIDTIAAGYGLENGGAKRLREAREKLQRDKEERQAQYRDYVNKIEAENRRIREFNAGIGNQLAFQQFQAENEYNRQLNLLKEQARLQSENGLYNTPL